MAKSNPATDSTTTIISNVATSTRQRPLVSVDGKIYDCNEYIAALQAARDVLPTDTFSRPVSVASGDAGTDADSIGANTAANLTTPQ